MFLKYERAVSDAGERARLRRSRNGLVIAWGMLILFGLGYLAVVLAGDAFALQETVWLLGGAMLLCFVAALCVTIVLRVRFRRSMLQLLRREPLGGEMPEVIAYRKVFLELWEKRRRRIGWSAFVSIALVALSVLCIVLEVILGAEGEELGMFGTAAGILLFLGLVFYFLVSLAYDLGQSLRGETLGLKAGKQIAAIDAAQGRPVRYRLDEDANLQSYCYLYPDEQLRSRIMAEGKRNSSLVIRFCIVPCFFVAVVACCVLNWWLDGRYMGYVLPAVMVLAAISGGVIGGLVQGRSRAIRMEQRRLLEADPAYEKNLRIMNMYDAFNHKYDRVLLAFCVAAFVLALALAVLFPHTIWSLAGILVLLAGLFNNNAQVKRFRLTVIPIEQEIDSERMAQAHPAAPQDEGEASNQAPLA